MTTHTEVSVVGPDRPREFAKRPFRLSSWARDTGWRHPIAIVAVIFAVFPLLYVVSASLNPSGSLVGSNPLFATVDCSGFAALFANPEQPYGLWFLNSLVISLLTSVATVFLGAMAAYAFSRMRFRGRGIGLLALILIQMFPQFLAVVALFLLLSAISDIVPALGLGTQLGLIMVYLGGALGVNTCPMYGFFSTVPISIDEARRSTAQVTRKSSSRSSSVSSLRYSRSSGCCHSSLRRGSMYSPASCSPTRPHRRSGLASTASSRRPSPTTGASSLPARCSPRLP